jgi:hypothetical protein
MKIAEAILEGRHGWLRNDNAPGDLWKAARCGAKTRRGTVCQCPAMRNGRCRLHGGLSTGPKTAEGIRRIQAAVTKHGRRTQAAERHRVEFQRLVRQARETLKWLGGPGNG